LTVLRKSINPVVILICLNAGRGTGEAIRLERGFTDLKSLIFYNNRVNIDFNSKPVLKQIGGG
jgi:hypothetical protein